MSLLGIKREELLIFPEKEVTWKLTGPEILHMYDARDALWLYDYQAALEGRMGCHARLKSKFCSDGFFFSKPVLAMHNFLMMIAKSMIWNYLEKHKKLPDYVVGVPTGATVLGRMVAQLLGVPYIEMEKLSADVFVINTKIKEGRDVWVIEDVCTRATATKIAIPLLEAAGLNIIEIEVILTRGGLTEIAIYDEKKGHRTYNLSWLLKKDMNEWDCPNIHGNRERKLLNPCKLCVDGSIPIYPKRNEKTWQLITTAQQLPLAA